MRPSLAKFLRVDTTKKAAALESVPRTKKAHNSISQITCFKVIELPIKYPRLSILLGPRVSPKLETKLDLSP